MRQSVQVLADPEGKWERGRVNMTLETNNKVRTGSRSMARVKLADGSHILLLPNSQAELENLSSVQKAIRLVRGRVRAVVSRMRSGGFQVKTPIGVASVRGTEFEVEFDEDGDQMGVRVTKGQVGVSKLGELSEEVVLNAGDRIRFGVEGAIGDPIRSGAIPLNRQDIRSEVQIARVKDSITSMAAEEARNADYQVGKSLIDVDGKRVRVEEYITRPASDKFKLVVLNERETRFDYYTYTGTFNTDLPADLSVALRQVNGKLGTEAPDYFLTAYETLASNTRDNITESATGGHLVKITFNGTTYTLTDNLNGSNIKTVEAAVLQGDGSYKIYNPLRDTFRLVSAANKDEAVKIGILDTTNDTYRTLDPTDTYWKTRFDGYTFSVNDAIKTRYLVKGSVARTLAIDLDATFTHAPIATISEFPSGSGSLHNRLSLFFDDDSKLVYNNYIINDDGQTATNADFAGIATGAAYQNELLKWNYQQKVKGDGMSDEINLVIDPRIGTMSGLIQQ